MPSSRAWRAQDQAREGRNICIELIQEMREIRGISGVHIMAYRQEDRSPRSSINPAFSGPLCPGIPSAMPQPILTGQHHDRYRQSVPRPRKSSSASIALRHHRRAHQSDGPQDPRRRDGGGDFSRVEADARAQVEAGAHMLDVNAGIPLADEPAILARAIQLVQSITDVPLCIDSSIVAALEAGLAVYKGKALVNSVTGEDERLESVLPLVKKYGAAVIAISNDETGISEDPDVRFAVAKKIVERAMDHGIPGVRRGGRSAGDAHRRHQPGRRAGHAPGPSAAYRAQGQHLLRRLEHQFRPAEPGRHQQCVSDHGDGAGMTSAITNPLHVEVVKASWAPTSCWATTPTARAGSAASAKRRRERRRSGDR
jgi:5-methyltetrahydrofolate--homocysteine methyltransferase